MIEFIERSKVLTEFEKIGKTCNYQDEENFFSFSGTGTISAN